MEDKLARWQAIRQVIDAETIHNQDDLLQRLKELGFTVTQATLSRDLKSLKVIKSPDGDGGYLYSLPVPPIHVAAMGTEDGTLTEEDVILFAKAFLSIAFSGSLGVVKTLPGFANSLAAVIDKQQWREVLGTVAGDDTILVVLKEGVIPSRWAKALVGSMPLLKDKIVL